MTASAVADHGVQVEGLSYDGVCLATGANFPDALSGGVLAGRHGTVMLLTRADALPAVVSYTLALNKSGITAWHFLGGKAAVSQAVRDEVAQLLE